MIFDFLFFFIKFQSFSSTYKSSITKLRRLSWMSSISCTRISNSMWLQWMSSKTCGLSQPNALLWLCGMSKYSTLLI